MAQSDKGLYFFDTRLISAWAVYANGDTVGPAERRAPQLRRRAHLPDQPRLPHRGRPDPAQTLGFVISRVARIGGMHEDLDITNHGQKPVRFNLEIAIRSDFADVFEVKVSATSCAAATSRTDWSEAQPDAAHHLPQRRLHPRVSHVGRASSELPAPSTPTAA